MNYSIEILEKEKSIIEKCLLEWQSKEFIEAKKEREKRLNDLIESIEILKNKKNITIKNNQTSLF